jgi:hypothetical protein
MSVSASAQKRKIQFQSINQFAIVGGESHINTAFQTINGIKFSNWSSKIGIGIDYYRYKTLRYFSMEDGILEKIKEHLFMVISGIIFP